jgi:two-component system, chemotaxis family, response regulator Rcp1
VGPPEIFTTRAVLQEPYHAATRPFAIRFNRDAWQIEVLAQLQSARNGLLLNQSDQGEPDQNLPQFSVASFELSAENRLVVLLAEDNRADVLIIEDAIFTYGLPIELHVVKDGEKAFEFIQRAEDDPQAPCPEMLLLDLNLPKRDGKEVLQRLRQSQKCKGIPVMVITPSDSPKDKKEVAQLGATAYFHKPSSYDEFLKIGVALKNLLEQHRFSS